MGLTGGIASGKSLVAKYLKDDLKVPVIDADDVTHDLYRHDPELKANIRREFGEDVFTSSGEVDRDKLGQIVFNDPPRLKLLSSWIHPKVRQKIAGFFREHANEKLAVAVIPILYESGLEKNYDEVWVVKATREQQLERLMTRPNMTREKAEARLNSQMPLEEKLKRADVVIDNTGSVEHTQGQVKRLVLSA